MSYQAELRLINDDGSLGAGLPDFSNLAFLDDATDIGTVTFDYPSNGRGRERLSEETEIALLIDGKEVTNSRFKIDEADEDLITDSLRITSWAGQTLLARFDEALVMPEEDHHMKEDQVTPAERKAFNAARREWYEQAKKEAIAAAKETANPTPDPTTEDGSTTDTHTGGASHRGEMAIAWATRQISTASSGQWYELCQSFVRSSFGLPGVFGSAASAWSGGHKHHSSPPENIPPGVPVYWAPNHVALSIGDSKCISTDIFRHGQPDVCFIGHIHDAWGLSLLGWTTDVSRVTIYP